MMDGEIGRLSETRMLLKVARIIIGHLEQPKDVNGIYLFDVEEAGMAQGVRREGQ